MTTSTLAMVSADCLFRALQCELKRLGHRESGDGCAWELMNHVLTNVATGGQILVPLLVQTLPGSSGTMRVQARGRSRRCALVVMGAVGS